MTNMQVMGVAPEAVELVKKDWRAGRPQIQPEIMTERGAEIFRLRVAYKKDDRLAFLGHLELIGTIERCIRRAQLPFRVGNGFAKRMGVQFSQALPVGASSEVEYFDLKLTEYVDPDEALERLLSATPPALAPFAVSYVDRSLPALEAWLNAAHWRCDILGDGLKSDALRWGFEDLLAKKELTYMRGDKQKVVNLETTLAGYNISKSSSDSCISFELDTLQDPRAALRPAVLIYEAQRIAAEAGLDGLRDIDSLKVCRISQAHVSDDGLLVKPL